MIVRETFTPITKIIGVTTLLGAADVDKIVTSTNMKVGTYTIAAQPTTPSKISVTVTAVGDPDTMGTIAIVGKDSLGNALSETLIPVADDTVWTENYFANITSITGASWVIEGANDTITIGVGMESKQIINGESITVLCMSGNIWINPNDTSVANNTALKLVEGMSADLAVKGSLSLISDSTGATYQIICW